MEESLKEAMTASAEASKNLILAELSQIHPAGESTERRIKGVKEDYSKKYLLTLEEAAEYTGVGINKLRELSKDENCPFILWNGCKRLFKRQKLEKYLDEAFSI